MVDFAGFDDFFLVFEVVEAVRIDAAGQYAVGPFRNRTELRAAVGIMQKGIFSVADIDETGVEAGHEFSDFADENVADGEVVVGFLVVNFDQSASFHERDFYAGWRGIDDKFFFHD